MKNRFLILPIALLLFVSCEDDSNTRPYGTTIEVPTEVSSIKEAIKIAQPNDTILLHPNEYIEWEIKIDKPVYITSLYSSEQNTDIIKQTIINADHNFRVFTITNVKDSIKMNGFTITGGAADGLDGIYDMDTWGGGIVCISAKLKLTNMIIENNSASLPNTRGIGGGIYADESSLILENVQVNQNYGHSHSGGLYLNNSSFVCNNSSFKGNRCYYYEPVERFENSSISIKNTIFMDTPTNWGYTNAEIFFTNCTGSMENIQSKNGFYLSNSPLTITNSNINIVKPVDN